MIASNNADVTSFTVQALPQKLRFRKSKGSVLSNGHQDLEEFCSILHPHWLHRMGGGYLEMWLQTMEKPNIKQICVKATQMADISTFFFFLLIMCKNFVCVPCGEICKRQLLGQCLGLLYSSPSAANTLRHAKQCPEHSRGHVKDLPELPRDSNLGS